MSATFQLTREYLAQVLPGVNPDNLSDGELRQSLGAGFRAWRDQYPARELVASSGGARAGRQKVLLQ